MLPSSPAVWITANWPLLLLKRKNARKAFESSLLFLLLIQFIGARCRRKLCTWWPLKAKDLVTRGIFLLHHLPFLALIPGLLDFKAPLQKNMSAINKRATQLKLTPWSCLRRGAPTGASPHLLDLFRFLALLTLFQKDGTFCCCQGRARFRR